MSRKNVLAAGLAVALAAATALSACSVSEGSDTGKDTPAASTGPLVFGAAIPLSGPLAVSGRALQSALTASAKYINDKGGAKGRQIQWKFQDNGFPSGTQAATAVRALVEDNVVGVLNFGTPGVAATYQYLLQQKVPNMILFSGLTAFEPIDESAASLFTEYKVQGAALGRYAKQKFAGQKVAVLYQNDDLGQSYLNGFKTQFTDIATAQPYASSDVDFSSQLNAMKASGAQVAACFCLGGQISQLLKFRQSSGWNVPVITESANAGTQLVAAVGRDLTENIISNDFFPPTSGADATPEMTEMLKNMQAQDSSIPVTSFTVMAAALNDVIKGVVEKAGGDISRQTFAKALHDTQLSGAWYGTTSSVPDSPARALFSCWKPNVIRAGVPVPDGEVTCEKDLS